MVCHHNLLILNIFTIKLTVTGGDIKVHLKRLPPTASEDILTCYFESQGENIEVTSVILLGDGEADVSLSGLTADGMFNWPHTY